MNLTSKRLLSFLAGCAGMCVLSATAATTWVADSFEEGSEGLPINEYKQTVSNDYPEVGVTTTNYVWVMEADDASTLTNYTYTYTGTRPITNTTAALVLNLATEGQTLIRNLGVTNEFGTSGSPIYVDTLIKFTPSEDDPTITDDTVKAAVFVNISSNLVVYNRDPDGGVKTNSITSTTIDPEKWYRLTILLGSFFGYPGFRVFIDDTSVTSSDAYIEVAEDDWQHTSDGVWFGVAASAGSSLSAIAFQGTGMIDELVVADTVSFGEPVGVLLTLAFNSTLCDVLVNDIAVTNGESVVTGTELVINAADWYTVTSVTNETIAVTYTGKLGERSSTGTVSAAESATVNIGLTQYTGTEDLSDYGYNHAVDLAKLSTWAIANGLTEAEVMSGATDLQDDYLMNTAPDTNAKLQISDIAVSNDTAYVTIITTDSSGNVTNLLSGINGTLKYYTATNLVTGFDTTNSVSVEGVTDSKQIEVPSSQGSFIKAAIE